MTEYSGNSLLSLSFFLTAVLSSLPASAADPEPASTTAPSAPEILEVMKEESVSIAVRHEQPISQAPSNVYVITDEDIRQSGAIDLPTVLRRIPGMEVMQTTGADFNVSMRGDNQLNANKLLVLVDGRSIYVDPQGSVNWKNLPVTLPEIRRIEVLKGPASAIYGFNAFDGVVNIITKSPEEMKGTTLQFGGGAYGTISSAAIYAGTSGKLGYRLSVGEDQTQQWQNGNSLAYRAYKFNVQTEYSLPQESSLSVSGGLVDANRYDGPTTGAATINSKISQGYANVAYEKPNFFARWWWNGLFATSEETFPLLMNLLRVVGPNGSSTLDNTFNTYNGELQHTLQLAANNSLAYGANYRYNTISGNLTGTLRHENRLGFYLNEEWRATQQLTAVAGVRYDLDTFIHPQFSPRIALLYKPAADHTLRASISLAYRPPTLIETYVVQQLLTNLPPPIPPPPPVNISGSKDLDPEEIVSYELSYQGWYFRHRLQARVSLFFNHLSNVIDTSGFGSTITFVNSKQADIYGGEAGLEFLATSWLTGFVNYAYEEIGQSFTGDAQRGAPRFKFNAGVRTEWENGLSGEATYNYVGAATYPVSGAFATFAPLGVTVPSSRVGSYNLLNLRGAYRFWRQKAAAGYLREAEFAVSAFNALNDLHKENPVGATIGSRVMGWLTVRF